MLANYSNTLFQQSLQDLIRAIRGHRRDETEFVTRKFAQVQSECRSTEPTQKAVAVLKLIYFQLHGFNISTEAFPMIEVMSRQEFWMKRIGYLVASLTLGPNTDVLLLTTNLLKKDLSNVHSLQASLALNFLACVVSEEISRECSPDVIQLLSSPRPYIRKKAILVTFRLVLAYPQLADSVIPRLKERLEDSDDSVVCSTVTTFAELASTIPKLVLPYVPLLYKVLQNSSNNWMSIKLLKTLTFLCPIEPRLAKKLVPLVDHVMKKTQAKSLLYECCCTIANGMLDQKEAVEVCAEKLSGFLTEKDPNLKYLSLFLMKKMEGSFATVIYRHRDTILDCLDDCDDAIRLRALNLVRCLISKHNFREIARILLRKLREATQWNDSTGFRDALISTLLKAGSYSCNNEEGFPNLSTLSDFQWYLTSILHGLIKLYYTEKFSVSNIMKIAGQFVDITVRVESIRKIAIPLALEWLWLSKGTSLIYNAMSGQLEERKDGSLRHMMDNALQPLIFSACWLLGEYSDYMVEQPMLAWRGLLERSPFSVHYSGFRLALFASWKLFLRYWKLEASKNVALTRDTFQWIQDAWISLRTSPDPLVQERTYLLYYLLTQLWKLTDDGKVEVVNTNAVESLIEVFQLPLKPVDSTTQSKYQPAHWKIDWNESLLDMEERKEIVCQANILGDETFKQKDERKTVIGSSVTNKSRSTKKDPFYLSSKETKKKQSPRPKKKSAKDNEESVFSSHEASIPPEEEISNQKVVVLMGMDRPPLDTSTSLEEPSSIALSAKKEEYSDIPSEQTQATSSSKKKRQKRKTSKVKSSNSQNSHPVDTNLIEW